MNLRSPKALALITALVVSAMLVGSLILLVITGLATVRPIIIVALFPGLVLISYFVFLAAIERFVHRRVRLIYKTIHRQKRSQGTQPSLDFGSDLLGKVNTEVETWAAQQSEEIEELRNQEEYRREFIGNMAHELKTPLFTMQGYMLTLLEGGLEDPNINKKYLRRAEKSLQRLINITEDLDEITKFESGQLQLNLERLNLTALALEVIDALELKAAESNIKLTLQKPNHIVTVIADRERVRQVVANLIVNSIKYGRDGGTTEVRFYDMDEYILTEVADDGPGIQEAHLPRLFERFFRVEESRSRDKGGSGLGLAIVKHIIDAHNQTINVRSTENVGSTFSFTLRKAT